MCVDSKQPLQVSSDTFRSLRLKLRIVTKRLGGYGYELDLIDFYLVQNLCRPYVAYTFWNITRGKDAILSEVMNYCAKMDDNHRHSTKALGEGWRHYRANRLERFKC